MTVVESVALFAVPCAVVRGVFCAAIWRVKENALIVRLNFKKILSQLLPCFSVKIVVIFIINLIKYNVRRIISTNHPNNFSKKYMHIVNIKYTVLIV